MHLSPEREHAYGDRVHWIGDAVTDTLLARFGAPEARTPELFEIINRIYLRLLHAALNVECSKITAQVPTRMQALTPQGVWSGELLDPAQKFAVVNLARAGTLPSQKCFEELHYFFHAAGLRQDHLMIARQTDAREQVSGAEIFAHKIGGSVEDRIVLIPDPMGATGSSMVQAIRFYRDTIEGAKKVKKWIGLHCMVTPEYLRKVRQEVPELIVFTARVDRGLSPEHVLASKPGVHWDLEKGLTEKQYIVPGAGGVGELLNNSFV